MALPCSLHHLDIIFINLLRMSISSFVVSMVPFKVCYSLVGGGAVASRLARMTRERAVSVLTLAACGYCVVFLGKTQLPQCLSPPLS